MSPAAQASLKAPKSKSNGSENNNIHGIESLIRAMLKKHRTPFMLIKRCILEKQYGRFRKYLPDITPYYAIKANPYPGIIKTFIELGTCFDVASGAEMKQVLRLGASPSKIIFANTIKSPEDIEFARRRSDSWTICMPAGFEINASKTGCRKATTDFFSVHRHSTPP